LLHTKDILRVRNQALSIGGQLLSRLHRRAEALDEACLRAQGHPHDRAIRQELLSYLEWDSSFHPEHAHPVIRELFQEVHEHSAVLLVRIQSDEDAPKVPDDLIAEIPTLRQRLARLVQVLAARHAAPPADKGPPT
jgi:hypothetical protein